MPVESISCPNCGAPLGQPPSEDPWFCLYCSSLLLVQDQAGLLQPVVQNKLDGEAMNSIKQLLISGKREEAIRRFQQLSGLDLEEARRMIDQMAADFSVETIFHQQLTRGGIVAVAASLLVFSAALLAWLLGWLNPWLAVFLMALAGFLLFVYGRGALTTLRYRNAPTAPARTMHSTRIGAVQRGALRVHTYLILLEVQPQGGLPFQAKAIIPVREENVARVRQGEMIQVKYLPGRPDSVIFHEV